MKNEVRLIDANALLRKLIDSGWLKCDTTDSAEMIAVQSSIDDAPAVDAVVLPCKIGDTVWGIRKLTGGHLRAFQSTVSEMQFVGSEMRLSITARGVCRGEWGKTIFATQEEAEGEIKRRADDEH